MILRSRQIARPRKPISDRLQWNGQYSSFRTYKLAIIGHLLQNGGGYLVNQTFHISYHKYAKQGENYLESEDFRMNYPDITTMQAKIDRSYLYGILISTNRIDGEQRILIKYETSHDGIAAWVEFLRDYDNNGSKERRIIKLESSLSSKYTPKYQGGFIKYMDKFQANFNQLDILIPKHYSEKAKIRIMYNNLKEIVQLRHLVQACKDKGMTYQEAAEYLRKHGGDDQDPRETENKENTVEESQDKNEQLLNNEHNIKESVSTEGLTEAMEICHITDMEPQCIREFTEDVRMGAMVHQVENSVHVQANIEYEKRFANFVHTPRLSYAICDSGADS